MKKSDDMNIKLAGAILWVLGSRSSEGLFGNLQNSYLHPAHHALLVLHEVDDLLVELLGVLEMREFLHGPYREAEEEDDLAAVPHLVPGLLVLPQLLHQPLRHRDLLLLALPFLPLVLLVLIVRPDVVTMSGMILIVRSDRESRCHFV